MEWGPCPNAQGAAGVPGKDREPDFSSLMISDSVDIVNFHDTQCSKHMNADCNKCGSGNDISTKQWNEVVQHYGRSFVSEISGAKSSEITAGAFFHPFQYFVRTLLTQLKPHIKSRIAKFLAENFGDSPVVSVHHRRTSLMSPTPLLLCIRSWLVLSYC